MLRFLLPALGLLCSLIFGFLALRGANLAQLGEYMTGLSSAPILIALVCLALDYAIRCKRWQIMLAQHNPAISWKNCAGPFLSSFALNNVLPLRAGDAVRAFAFEEPLGVKPALVIGTLLLERLLDLLGLLVFFSLGSLALGATEIPAGVEIAIDIAFIAALIGVGLLLLAPTLVGRISAASPGNQSLSAKLMTFAADSLAGLQALVQLPILLKTALLTMLAWALEAGVFIFAIAALGYELPMLSGIATMTIGTLSTLIPSSPGYIGTFDYFTRVSLELFGMSADQALSAALVTHLVLWLPITLAGLSWLWLHWGGDLVKQATRYRKMAEKQ